MYVQWFHICNTQYVLYHTHTSTQARYDQARMQKFCSDTKSIKVEKRIWQRLMKSRLHRHKGEHNYIMSMNCYTTVTRFKPENIRRTHGHERYMVKLDKVQLQPDNNANLRFLFYLFWLVKHRVGHINHGIQSINTSCWYSALCTGGYLYVDQLMDSVMVAQWMVTDCLECNCTSVSSCVIL